MITKIINKPLIINNVPLEKTTIDQNMIVIEFDDVNEKRHKVVFKPYQAIKITTADCVDKGDLITNESLESGRYQRHILEVENSKWTMQLKKTLKENDENANFMDKARHFILDLRDNIIEIISLDFELFEV